LKIYPYLNPSVINLRIRPGDKSFLLEQLADLLPLPAGLPREPVVEELKKREAISSTGIGDGVAIPHAKLDIAEDLVFALGVCPVPQPFDSIDHGPVQIFVLAVSRKDATGPHIRALAQVARLMQSGDFRSRLIQARTPEEAIALFREFEDKNP
jgi:mannitol/fructose-specific phosphotransferase system IIA component (Ntr-type)